MKKYILANEKTTQTLGYELRSTGNVFHFKVEDTLEKFLFDRKIDNTDIIEVCFRLYKPEETEE